MGGGRVWLDHVREDPVVVEEGSSSGEFRTRFFTTGLHLIEFSFGASGSSGVWTYPNHMMRAVSPRILERTNRYRRLKHT